MPKRVLSGEVHGSPLSEVLRWGAKRVLSGVQVGAEVGSEWGLSGGNVVESRVGSIENNQKR